MTTVITTHTRKPVVRNPAVKVPQHHLPDIGTIKSVSALKPVFADLLEYFKTILHALVIGRVLKIVVSINRFRHRYGTFLKTGVFNISSGNNRAGSKDSTKAA